MNCSFTRTGDVYTCEVCGRLKRVHGKFTPHATCNSPGLGDRVARAIKFAAKLLYVERLVEETPGCGCRKRRETLNAWGRWLRSRR